MKFGLRYCNQGDYADPEAAVALIKAAEAAGFESAWASDHPIMPLEYGSKYPYTPDGQLPEWGDFVLPDPLIWLSYVAAHTSHIRLGTAVMILPMRNPIILAKQIASLDRLSSGRMILGIGVGWLEEEFNAIGSSFKNRGRRADEYIEVMRTIWNEETPEFAGEFINFPPSLANPKPVNPSIPITIGGDSKFAARRAGRIGNGYLPVGPEPWELIDLARRTAEENGRNANDIEVTVPIPDDLEDIPKLAERGVKRLLVPVKDGAGVKARISGAEGILKFREIIQQFENL